MNKIINRLFPVTIFLLINILIFKIDDCSAQWVQCDGIYGGDVRSLAVIGNNIFAGTEGYGVYLSTDKGMSWTQTALKNQIVNTIAISENNIFAGTKHGGVYLSTNNGTSWNQTGCNGDCESETSILTIIDPPDTLSVDSRPIQRTLTALNKTSVYSLAILGNNIFAGTRDDGIFISNNNGTSWTQTALNNKWVRSLIVSGNNIFAGTGSFPNPSGVYLSINNGKSWTQTTLNNEFVLSLATSENNIFSGKGMMVFLSLLITAQAGLKLL